MDKAIQAAQKSPKNHDNKWIKPQNEELKKLEIQTPSAPKDKRLNSIRKPRGHKEDWASFPTQSQYKVFKNPSLKS